MSQYEHSRNRVVNQLQHPLKHTLAEFIFSHPALPANLANLDAALTWLFDAVYPQTKAPVANVAALPAVSNTIGDQRVVQDDGDGKAALYKWAQYDGEATPSWHKIMDVDWSVDSILSEMVNRTQPHFVLKKGNDDTDETGTVIAGILSGQIIFGGASANTNLTLFANNGDPSGNTGFIQLGDNTSPLVDDAFSLGEVTRRFSDIYSTIAHIGSITISDSSIVDANGAIDFFDNELTTTGACAFGDVDIAADIHISTGSIISTANAISFGSTTLSTLGDVIANSFLAGSDLTITTGSITSLSGNISFDDENLITTGDITADILNSNSINVGSLIISADTISAVGANNNVRLVATGLGNIYMDSPIITLSQNVTGTVAIGGLLTIDNLLLDNGTITSNIDFTLDAGVNNLIIASKLIPSVTATQDIGSSTKRFKDLYLSGALKDGTNAFTMADLMSLRSTVYRDSARTQPAQAGDALFFDGSVWLASVPNTEIIHKNITLDTATDDGHTQFVMLGGRAGGQTIKGGTLTTQILSLRDNAVDLNGLDISGTSILPTGDGTQTVGSSSKRIKDLYQSGEMIGSRVQNVLDAAVAGLMNASSKGRMIYATDTKAVYVDVGGTKKRVGHNSYNVIHTHTTLNAGAVNVTTGTDITDATNCIWQLRDTATGELILAPMTVATNTVTVSASPALPSGSYKLMGIEV